VAVRAAVAALARIDTTPAALLTLVAAADTVAAVAAVAADTRIGWV